VEEAEEEEPVQMKREEGGTPSLSPDVESSIASGRGAGRPLDKTEQAFFASRFDRDFGDVRIHTDGEAGTLAKAVQAKAFTVGRDIYFGWGEYSPGSSEGRRLLAHELTHVIQQRPPEEERLIRSPDCSIWGGFRICGDAAFISSVRSDLNTLNGTTQGSSLLGVIAAHRAPWYRSLIKIESSGACGLTGTAGYIQFNASGCSVADKCTGSSTDWTSVPNYIWLFHEIVHAYMFHVTGQGTHPNRECMVTGLGRYFSTMPYSENRLRCELGLPVRPCYDGECSSFAPPSCATAGTGGGGVRPRVQAAEQSRSGFDLQRQKEEEETPEKLPEMKKCPEKMKEQITSGITEARQMAARSLVALKRDIPLSYEDRAMREHFGTLSGEVKRTVISRFEDIHSTLQTKEIECRTKCPKKGADLCAQAETPGRKIFICPNFGTPGCAPGPTMLHEAAHNAGAKDDIDKGDKYPPKKAEDNAYSYEYFPQGLREAPEPTLRPKKEIKVKAP
jgi:hypothetical protein